MRPTGSPEDLEARRRRAINLLQDGWSAADAAERLGTTATSVRRWWRAFQKDGIDALDAKPATGGPSKLTERQCDLLVQILKAGPAASGFPVDRWDAGLIRSLIRAEFGVVYHENSVQRLLYRLRLFIDRLSHWRPWMGEY